MGYGEKLKQAIDAKGITVKDLSRAAGISATTLYSAIKRDSALRYDHALRVASVLSIDVNEICKSNPYIEDGPELPELLPEMGGLLTDINISSYVKHRTMPILHLLGYSELANVDRLLCEYYTLSDEGRKSVFAFLKAITENMADENRKKELMDMNNLRK